MTPRGSARPPARPVLGTALAAACLLGAAACAQAQETVVIGGGPTGTPPGAPLGGGAVGTVGQPESGIVINDSVLDSLGPGGPAAGIPMAAPRMPVHGATVATPGAAPGMRAPGAPGAYRLPETGQLVVTRPSTLLHPPMEPPKSHLALPPARAKRAGPGSGGKLTSRLIAAPPKQRLAKPSTPPAADIPKAAIPEAPPAAPKTAEKSAPAPAMPEAPTPSAATGAASPAAPVPAKPSVPPPPSLAKEIQGESGAPATAPETPAISATIAPKPDLPEPSPPSAAAPPPPKLPGVPVPLAAAPAEQAAEAAAPAAQPTAVQDAARTTGDPAEPPGGDLRLSFDPGSAELSNAAKQELLGLAETLAQDASGRVQLLAYAADDGEGASRARRLSLSRALAVRAFLIEQGVRSTRMDVRALGSKAGDGPADRVDVLPQ